jgi:predicted NBD/HSP70 family sugar kinase
MKNLLCIDIGGTFLKYGLVTPDYTVIHPHKRPSHGQEGITYLIASLFEAVDEMLKIDKNVAGIAIGTPGVVDITTGTVIAAGLNIPGLIDTCFKKILKKKYHLPVSVENDVNCFGHYENVLGIGQNVPSMIYLTIGTGIGGAIFLQHQIHYGANYGAGEFGITNFHRTVWERIASTAGLIRKAQEVDASLTTGEEVFLSPSKAIKIVIRKWYHELAKGITNLILSFNPHLIILGGAITARPEFLHSLKKEITLLTPKAYLEATKIQVTTEHDSGILGSAVFFRSQYPDLEPQN